MVYLPKKRVRVVADFNLDATLRSGQAFCWRHGSHGWSGWIGDYPVQISCRDDEWRIRHDGISEAALAHYFQWQVPLPEILSTFPDDLALREALAFAPGLRLLRQPPWETVANFICSAQKQIVQIEQINTRLRDTLGVPHGSFGRSFPSAEQVYDAGEQTLRACRLGYRARHLAEASRQVAMGEVSLEAIETLPTAEARIELMRLRGVGEKVANCVLLFAYGRHEAFPVDVWVERILRDLYFSKKRKVTSARLRDFAASYFGPHPGYAQQYLFHWYRLKKASSPQASEG